MYDKLINFLTDKDNIDEAGGGGGGGAAGGAAIAPATSATTMSNISYLPSQLGVVTSAMKGLKKKKKKWNIEILEGEGHKIVQFEDQLKITVPHEHWDSFAKIWEGGIESDVLDLDGMLLEESEEESSGIFWHGSPSGDFRGGKGGLHIGTYKAAKQALEARIGVPAEGEWDGTREYGKTLLAGKKTLQTKDPREYLETGINCDAPIDDYFPTGNAKYGDGTVVPMTVKPNIFPVYIIGEMTNTPTTPYEDFKAGGYMAGQIKRGNAKRGYYYENVAEDVGSISAVVPNVQHIEKIAKKTNESEKEDELKLIWKQIDKDTYQSDDWTIKRMYISGIVYSVYYKGEEQDLQFTTLLDAKWFVEDKVLSSSETNETKSLKEKEQQNWYVESDSFGNKIWKYGTTFWSIQKIKQLSKYWYDAKYNLRGIEKFPTLNSAKQAIEYNYEQGFVPKIEEAKSLKETIEEDMKDLRKELKIVLVNYFNQKTFTDLDKLAALWKSVFGISSWITPKDESGPVVSAQHKDRDIQRLYGNILREYGDDKGNLELLIKDIKAGRPLSQYAGFKNNEYVYGYRISSNYETQLIFEVTIDHGEIVQQSMYMADDEIADAFENETDDVLRVKNVFYPHTSNFTVIVFKSLKDAIDDIDMKQENV